MFKVLNAYTGWSNVNYVLNDVKNPVRTLKISGPLGLGICAALYFLANVAFFAYVVVFSLLWMTDNHALLYSERQQNKKSKIQVSLSLLCFSRMYLELKRRGRFRLLLR
jgi:amino acid transporter